VNRNGRVAVLLVEDEQIIARDLQQTLIEMGYDAFAIADCAEAALARAAERCPDIVLMDIRIKGPLDGIQTAALLQEKFPVSVIYLTAHADAPMIERAKKTEPYGYLLKPVKAAELRAALDIASYRRELEAARTQMQRLEAEKNGLLQAQMVKDRFLRNMAHELRTPLNGVIGFAELMQDGVAGPLAPEQQEFVQHVLASGRRFLQLINNILDLADRQAGQPDLHPGSIDLPALIHDVIESLRPPAAQKQLQVGSEVDPTCAHVVNDPVMLRQMLYNYLANAIKFSPEGAAVTVRGRPHGQSNFRVEVTDRGPGIPPRDLGRLFVPFEQLDSGYQKKFDGLGLGLALTRRMVESQGGSVGFEQGPQGESVFFAVLPRELTSGRTQDATV
jgi:signal transduction histidine kinase